MRKIIIPCISILAICSAGCATVVRGTTENITFNSEPSGAVARTSIGMVCESTPCIFEMLRKADFTVTYSKAGYHDQQVPVIAQMGLGGGTAMAGNILGGGIIGAVVDSNNGATLEHSPNPVFVTLDPIQRTAPVAERRHGHSKRPAPTS